MEGVDRLAYRFDMNQPEFQIMDSKETSTIKRCAKIGLYSIQEGCLAGAICGTTVFICAPSCSAVNAAILACIELTKISGMIATVLACINLSVTDDVDKTHTYVMNELLHVCCGCCLSHIGGRVPPLQGIIREGMNDFYESSSKSHRDRDHIN